RRVDPRALCVEGKEPDHDRCRQIGEGLALEALSRGVPAVWKLLDRRLRRRAREAADLHREAAGHAPHDVAEGLRAGVVDLAGGDETCVVGSAPGTHRAHETATPA